MSRRVRRRGLSWGDKQVVGSSELSSKYAESQWLWPMVLRCCLISDLCEIRKTCRSLRKACIERFSTRHGYRADLWSRLTPEYGFPSVFSHAIDRIQDEMDAVVAGGVVEHVISKGTRYLFNIQRAHLCRLVYVIYNTFSRNCSTASTLVVWVKTIRSSLDCDPHWITESEVLGIRQWLLLLEEFIKDKNNVPIATVTLRGARIIEMLRTSSTDIDIFVELNTQMTINPLSDLLTTLEPYVVHASVWNSYRSKKHKVGYHPSYSERYETLESKSQLLLERSCIMNLIKNHKYLSEREKSVNPYMRHFPGARIRLVLRKDPHSDNVVIPIKDVIGEDGKIDFKDIPSRQTESCHCRNPNTQSHACAFQHRIIDIIIVSSIDVNSVIADGRWSQVMTAPRIWHFVCWNFDIDVAKCAITRKRVYCQTPQAIAERRAILNAHKACYTIIEGQPSKMGLDVNDCTCITSVHTRSKNYRDRGYTVRIIQDPVVD